MCSRLGLLATTLQLCVLQTKEQRKSRCCWFTITARKLLMACSLFVLVNYKEAKSSESTTIVMLRVCLVSSFRVWTKQMYHSIYAIVAIVPWLMVWCATASGHGGHYSLKLPSKQVHCPWTIHTTSHNRVIEASTRTPTVEGQRKRKMSALSQPYLDLDSWHFQEQSKRACLPWDRIKRYLSKFFQSNRSNNITVLEKETIRQRHFISIVDRTNS